MAVIVLTTALGCAIIGGVFWAFSTFVMRALAQRPVPEGVAVMQAINVTVITPLFLGPFMGTALLGVVLLLIAFTRDSMPGAGWQVAGALLYLVGTFLVTMFGNVPLNNRLEKVTPESREAHDLWARYLERWVFWNHVRTLAALAALVALVLGVLQQSGSTGV